MATRKAYWPRLKLQFKQGEIAAIAARYTYPGEEHNVDEISSPVRSRGYYTRDGFIEKRR
jgi:hypothetical protein